MRYALLPDGARKPVLSLRAAIVVLTAGWFGLPIIDARAQQDLDEVVLEEPAKEEEELPLIARPKKDKCEEYAELTGTNQYFCTRYMNERLLEILLTSAREAEKPVEPIRDVGR